MSVVIEGVIEYIVCRETRVEARRSEQVECQDGLRNQPIPKVQREVRVARRYPEYQVRFKGLDRALGGVYAMKMRWYKRELDALFLEVCDESLRALIVQ